MASLPYDVTRNATFIGIGQSKVGIRDVATGRRIMVLICSDPGLGKSRTAKQELRRGNVPFHECAPSTEQALVRVLWSIESGQINHKGSRVAVILADDQDGMWRRETIVNQLKSGFGADRRRVIWETPESLKNEERRTSAKERDKVKYRAAIPPPWFDVTVGLIGLANINYTDPAVVAGLPEHFRALISKGLDPLWIPNDAEHDGLNVFLYTHWLATEGKSLRGEGYSYAVARDSVEFYVRNVHRLIDIPPRRLSQIAYTIKHNPNPQDQEIRLASMLRSTDQRPKLKLPASWISVLLWPSDPPQRPDVDPEHVKPVLDDAPNGRMLNDLAEIDPGAGEAPIYPSVANNANQADPPIGQGASRTGTADTFLLSDITPRSESLEQEMDPLDVALDGRLEKTTIKTVQDGLNLVPFRGPVGRAHAVRAQYYTAVKASTSQMGGTVSVPRTLGEKDRLWWDRQVGKTARQVGNDEHASVGDPPDGPTMNTAEETEGGAEAKPFRPNI